MSADQLSSTFSALADPTRRAILAHLMTGEATVSELTEPFAVSMAAISKHLKVLESAGLVTRSHEAQRRPCRIQAAPLKDASEWIESYRMAWEQRLNRLHNYLHELKAKEYELKAKELKGKELSVKESKGTARKGKDVKRKGTKTKGKKGARQK